MAKAPRNESTCPKWARGKLENASKSILRNIVGRESVGASDELIRALVREKLQKAANLGCYGFIAKAQAYAVKEHHQNRAVYNRVMGGRLGGLFSSTRKKKRRR